MVGRIYSWIVGSGDWGTAADWDNISNSVDPSLTVPGTADSATIQGPATATTYVVSGPGSASSLTLDNNVALAGDFSLGIVTLSTLIEGTVNLLPGSVLSTGSLVATSQTLSVDGAGAQVLDSGTFSLQGFGEVEASNGGFIQTGPMATADGTIAVDPTGTFEVGSAGGAPAGTLSVDAGGTLQALSSQLYAPVVVNGLIDGNGQFFNAAVSGGGTVSITGATRFETAVAAGVNVVFPGAGGDLTLVDPADFAATVSGFGEADTIGVNAPGITSLSYTGGVLALLADSTTVGTIALTGTYTASQFLLLPFGGAYANANISVATNAPTAPAAAPAGPGNTDDYSWTIDTGGAWGTAANWLDTTTSTGAAPPPGSLNAVAIASAIGGYQIVNGDGNSASLTLTGQTALNGVFNTGTLTMTVTLALIPSSTELLPGSVLNATAANLSDTMDIDGSTLAVSGTLAVGTATLGECSMFVFDQGFVRTGTLALGIASFGILGIDSGSTVEVGSAGGAAAGALTVDAGSTADIAGDVDGNVVNNGVILASDGEFGITGALDGTISGTGTIELAAGASLSLQGNVTAGGSIAFGAGSGLGIQLPGTLAALLTGFTVGDSITTGSAEVAGVLFTSATGALVLTDASANPLVTLDMAGSFTGDSFLALPSPGLLSGSSGVVLAAGTLQNGAPPAPAPGTPDAENYTWTASGGVWGVAANWSDTTAGQPVALFAPGSEDLVTIPGSTITPGGWQVVSGAGDAASLTVAGKVALSGNFAPAALAVTGALDVVAGASVAVTSAMVSGSVLVDGTGASLGVTGVLTLNGALSAAAHANVVAGGLTSTGGASVFVDPTATVEIGTAGGAVAGALNIDPGISVSTEDLTVTGNLVNRGTVAGADFTLSGSVSGNGVLAMSNGGFSRLTGSVAATQTLALGGADSVTLGTLALPTISNFAPGDALSLEQDVTGASWSGGVLTLTDDTVPVETLSLSGDYTGATFIVTPQPAVVTEPLGIILTSGATVGAEALGTARSEVTLASTGIACFASGTRIATPTGDVAVEFLSVGDRVCSAFGGVVGVRWIGHRTLDCRRHPCPAEVMPVRVRAGAFAEGVPVRDLVLSPDHAVFVEGRLIPIRYLINGATIVQEVAGRVTYWHVELPVHDVIVAEGLAAESYLDTGNRGGFANGGGAVQAHPIFARAIWEAEGCAPLLTGGTALATVQAALLARAETLGFATTDQPDLRLIVERQVLHPVRVGALYRFALPPGVGAAVLASRDFVPARQWPGNADHRRLGVAVARLVVDGREVAPAGTGWHAPEPGFRWTDGAAAIALNGVGTLEVTLAMTGRYWAATTAPVGRRVAEN